MKSTIPYIVILQCALLAACGVNKRSERDSAREQMRINAEAKRQELALVAANYHGTLTLDDQTHRQALLTLVVKDNPQTSVSGVDAELVPQLAGFLSIGGSAATPPTKFAVTRAEYDAASLHLDIIAENSRMKSIKLDLKLIDSSFVGSWINTEASQGGRVEFSLADPSTGSAKPAEEAESVPTKQVNSSHFSGTLTQNNETFRTADMKFTFSPDGPDTFRTDGVLRIFASSTDRNEYEVIKLDNMVLDPFTMTVQSLGSSLTVSGTFGENGFQGHWNSSALGIEGQIVMQPSSSLEQNGGTP